MRATFRRPFKFSRLAWAALGCAALVLAGGCGTATAISEPERPQQFGEEVDSVVVQPVGFSPTLATEINPAEQLVFREVLTEKIGKTERLRVFDAAPTELRNTLLLEPTVVELDIQEQPGPEVFLRTIHLGMTVRVRTGDSLEPTWVLRQRLSYQKIYLPDDEVPVATFDLRGAVGELAELVVDEAFPRKLTTAVPLHPGTDPLTFDDLARPTLKKGNNYAAAGRYARAADMWRLVLFSPAVEVEEPLFRLSPRAMDRLRAGGLEPEILAKLRPLTFQEATELVDFRAMVREALGGYTPREAFILSAADFNQDRTYLNISAAHQNLGGVHWIAARYDLASFHLARAYVAYPDDRIIQRWSRLQRERKLFPEALSEREALTLYARLPPPRGARVRPGPAENGLLPVLELEPPEFSDGVPEGAVARPPPEDEAPSPFLQPTERPPPGSGDSESTAPGLLPPVQSLERAGTRG